MVPVSCGVFLQMCASGCGKIQSVGAICLRRTIVLVFILKILLWRIFIKEIEQTVFVIISYTHFCGTL